MSGHGTGTLAHSNPLGHVSSPQASCACAVFGVPNAAAKNNGAPKSHKLRSIRLIVLPPDLPIPYASTLAPQSFSIRPLSSASDPRLGHSELAVDTQSVGGRAKTTISPLGSAALAPLRTSAFMFTP